MTTERTHKCIEELQGISFSLRSGVERIERLQTELQWDEEHPDQSSTTPEERHYILAHVDTLLGLAAVGSSAGIEAVRQDLIMHADILSIGVDDRGEV